MEHSSDDEQWINTSTWVARKSVSLMGLHETPININSSLSDSRKFTIW